MRLTVAFSGLWVGVAFFASIPFWLATSVAAGAGVSMCLRRMGIVRMASLGVACACLGGAIGGLDAASTPVERLAASVPRCDLTAGILEDDGKLGVLLSAARIACGHRVVADAGTLMVDDPGGQPGGMVRGGGWLIPLRGAGFDQARRRAGAQASFSFQGEPSIAAPTWPPQSIAAAIRTGLHRSTSGLAPDTASLLSGLTVGDTKAMPTDVTDDLRRAGLSHLVAVSGSNVAIVLALVMGCLRTCPMRLRVAAGLAGLGLYVLVTGPDASVLRAAAMGAVALVSLLGGRRAQPLNAMLIGLIAILALRPSLVGSVGLQLSAAATAGIVVFAPRLMGKMGGLPRAVVLVGAATIGAQIAVAPLLLGTFGQLSIVSPLANLLAEAAVAPATIIGLAGGCIGALNPAIGGVVARLASPFVMWILWVGRSLGSPAWAAIEVPHWTGAVAGVVVLGAAARILLTSGDT